MQQSQYTRDTAQMMFKAGDPVKHRSSDYGRGEVVYVYPDGVLAVKWVKPIALAQGRPE